MMKSVEETKMCTSHLNKINSLPFEGENYGPKIFLKFMPQQETWNLNQSVFYFETCCLVYLAATNGKPVYVVSKVVPRPQGYDANEMYRHHIAAFGW